MASTGYLQQYVHIFHLLYFTKLTQAERGVHIDTMISKESHNRNVINLELYRLQLAYERLHLVEERGNKE